MHNLTSLFSTGLKFLIKATKIILTSKVDKCYPIQFLGPAEKGVNAYVGTFFSLSHLSGLNSSGSSKYSGFLKSE